MPTKGDLATAHQPVFNDFELRFIEEYCVDLDPKLAVKRCGRHADNDSEARVAGNRMLRNAYVAEAIDRRLAELSKKTVSNAVYVRDRLVEVVERCMQKEQVMERQYNEETKKTELMPTGEWTFNAQGANKALELLGRHHGMFTDKVVITIEHELKQMTDAELDARIARLMTEKNTMDLVQGPDGVYTAPPEPVAVLPPLPRPPGNEPADGPDAIDFKPPEILE
jgi:phage terminase small subunit